MVDINFFTPLVFSQKERTVPQWLCETLDGLFWAKGQRVCVLKEEGKSVGLWMGEEPDANGVAALVALIAAGVLLPPLVCVSLIDLGRRSINVLAGTKFLGLPRLLVVGSHSSIALAALTVVTRCALHYLYLPNKFQTLQERLKTGVPEPSNDNWKGIDGAIAALWKKGMELPESVKLLNTHNPSKDKCAVFTTSSCPNAVFKVVKGTMRNAKQRWKNLQRAEGICLRLGLDKLVVPRVQLVQRDIDGQKYDVLLCEKLEIDEGTEDDQRENYEEGEAGLTDSLVQLGRFILHTGFDDVQYWNAPLTGENQIALIDLDVMSYGTAQVCTGIRGSFPLSRAGLLALCSEDQKRAITSALRGHPNWPS